MRFDGYHLLVSFAGSICFCIGEQKAEAFCEAVNCEQSEQEGKFLFCDVDCFHMGYNCMIPSGILLDIGPPVLRMRNAD